MTRKELTDEEIARKCPGCRYSRFIAGVFVCQLRTCKYRVTRPTRVSRKSHEGGKL